jgi:hypothetical protein
MPDCIWDQPVDQRSSRNNADFAELGDRKFVRGLMPVPIETGDEFRYGVWLEVDEATFRRVLAAWNEPDIYIGLEFTAGIANAAPPWGEHLLGAEVDVRVRDAGARLFITDAKHEWLRDLIARGWTKDEYRAAVATLRT